MKVKIKKKTQGQQAEQVSKPTMVQTISGPRLANPGDWIITGEMGEEYPITDQEFKKTFDILPE